MNKDLKDRSFAEMTHAEKREALEEKYAETGPEMAELGRMLTLAAEYARKVGIPARQTWATLVVAAADALELDLDSEPGMLAASMIAHYQMQEA